MVPEARLERTAAGLVPTGEGWFVLNARAARWAEGRFGAFTRFEGEPRFAQLGINVSVLQTGQPACMYPRMRGSSRTSRSHRPILRTRT